MADWAAPAGAAGAVVPQTMATLSVAVAVAVAGQRLRGVRPAQAVWAVGPPASHPASGWVATPESAEPAPAAVAGAARSQSTVFLGLASTTVGTAQMAPPVGQAGLQEIS